MTSANGLATVDIESGSLPEGTTIDDIRIQAVVVENPDPGVPFILVELLPHGLVLSEPATVTVTPPSNFDGALLTIHQSGDFVEFPDGDIVLGEDGPRFTTSISNFSYLAYFDVGSGSLNLTPQEVSPGQSQNGRLVGVIPPQFDLVLGDLDCTTDCPPFRAYQFEVVLDEVVFETIQWSEIVTASTDPNNPSNWDEFWNPGLPEVSQAETDVGWDTFASSTCVIPNRLTVGAGYTVELSVTLVASSEAISLGYIHLVDGSTPGEDDVVDEKPFGDGRSNRKEQFDLALSGVQTGDTFKARAFIGGLAETVCTDVADITTSTLSTLPPIEEPPGVDPPDDQGDGSTSQPVDDAQRVDGAEIISTKHVPSDAGLHCIETVVLGDGPQATQDALNFLIDVEIHGDDDLQWKVFVEFFQGDVRTSRVFIGPNAPGRERLDDAIVTAEWISTDTNSVCVEGGETDLSVDSYLVKFDAFIDGGHVYDEAEGVGSP